MAEANRIKRDEDRQAAQLDIHAMPGHLIRRMHQACQAVFDSIVAAAGFDLTSVQYAALSAIAARPGLDQATLAALIAFDRATTGGVIDRLEAKGLVRREIAAGDRRARRLFVEPAGRRMLDVVSPLVGRAQETMLQGLSASERREFVRLLIKALSAVADVSRPSGRANRSMAGPRRKPSG